MKPSSNALTKPPVNSPRVKIASENYRKAMRSDKERDQLIEDYLPLVKSIVVRMRHNFPEHYDMEDMYGVGVKALVISGGGSKGAFAGGIAQYLIEEEQKNYDLFVGTSTGSLMLTHLALGKIDELKTSITNLSIEIEKFKFQMCKLADTFVKVGHVACKIVEAFVNMLGGSCKKCETVVFQFSCWLKCWCKIEILYFLRISLISG